MKIGAIILAAGCSERMGRYKLTIDIGGKSVIEHTISGVYNIADDVVLVIGCKKEELKHIPLKYSKVRLIENPNYQLGMFSSVKKGLSEIEADYIFIIPGDCPLIKEDIYKILLEERDGVVVPSYKKRAGHPVMVNEHYAKLILKEPDTSNLKNFMKRHKVKYVEVEDDGILMDMDREEDLKKIRERIKMQDISKPIRRVDAPEKIGGVARFVDDHFEEGMLYVKIVRSTKPRARIKHIKLPDLPDGYAVVDRHDVPHHNRIKMIFDDWPFFAEDVVNYYGEPILAIVGPDREKVYELSLKVEIEYEDIPPIYTIEESEENKKPPIFKDNNLFADYFYEKGDIDQAFKKADEIIEEEFRTGFQEHIYLEPQGMIAKYENGKITVWGSMQCPYYVKNALLEAFGFPEDKIRVVQTTTGGGFGGKEEYPSQIAGIAAFCAYKTKKPVKLIYDRAEDVEFTTKRHPSRTRIKAAIKDGRVTGIEFDIALNAGAYAGLSSVVLQRGMFAATGAYNIQNVRVFGKAFATNMVPMGAFRGFGAPQAIYAIETFMNHVAKKLKKDPIEFKLSHRYKKGDTTATGGLLRSEVRLPEIVQKIVDMSKYHEKKHIKEKNGKLYGIGFSMFLHGCGFTGNGEEILKSVARLKKRKDNKVEILVSNVEMGQGPQTTLRKVVSEALDIPLSDVIYDNPDTDKVPDSGPTVASRTAMIVGGLLYRAAMELKEKWEDGKEIIVEKQYRHPEYIKWDQKTFHGDAYPEYSWGANIVEVEVDPITYEIDVKKAYGVSDLGTPLDRKIIEGQIHGGMLQGIGYATLEVMEFENGRFKQRNITDYIIPTVMDAPKFETDLVVEPYENGPFGAKCAGELPFVGAAPSVCAAVEDALGINLYEIPIRPEKLLSLMEKK